MDIVGFFKNRDKAYEIDAGRRKPFFVRGGISIAHQKYTKDQETVVMPPAKEIVIPMSQHIGAECVVCVKKGDYVCVGDLLGDSDAFISAPIYSSVSGTVTKIGSTVLPNGKECKAVYIESDGQMKLSDGIEAPEINTLKDFLQAVRKSGATGFGGAGFPIHVKLTIKDGKSADTLIVNAAECEPYITSDHRECIENCESIFRGIIKINEFLKFKRVIIAVEENKPDVIRLFSQMADNAEYNPLGHIKVLRLKSQYPQGAEKTIIKSCTNREVPSGKLPLDVGCIVLNVTSVSFIYKYLQTGVPLISKRVTVSGENVVNQLNVLVPIGTKVSDLIEFCGGVKEEIGKVVLGGPMMGSALASLDSVIIKQTNGLLLFSRKDSFKIPKTACIRCGKCVRNCPMGLMPGCVGNSVKIKDTESLNKLKVLNCMECGLCSYNCPAGRDLIQTMKLAKSIVSNSK